MSRFTIETAEHSGFCFGVSRAVELAENTAKSQGHCCTLGPLIHNRSEIERLETLGVTAVDSPDKADGTIIIRSHGIPLSLLEEIKKSGKSYIDATCPFVAKIHDIVANAEGGVIIAGDKAHPEVIGIVGHCKENAPVYVVSGEEELELCLKDLENARQNTLTMVAQTTYNSAKWQSCKKIAENHYTNIKIFDTICNATTARQSATEKLAKKASLMIVVGGKNSSNTAKLAEISQKHCPVLFVQSGSDIDTAEVKSLIEGGGIAGITAGASTPAYKIKEVHEIMSEMNEILNEEETGFTMEMVDKSFKKIYKGQKVTATVEEVKNSEVIVDLGTKHTAYITADELSQNPNAVPSDIVSVGDKIEAIVIDISDADGVAYLSKKKADTQAGAEKLAAAMEAGETLEGEVTTVVKGGVIVIAFGTRVFIPASHTGVPKDGKLEELLKTTVPFKVIEVSENRNKIVGSIRQAKREANDAARAKFWETIEEGQKFTGEVKSIESYGVFVDLGGVDGMVHSSELTWSRIKHPKEIVSIGDKLDVYVKSFDIEKKRVSLGCKKPEDNPWIKFMAEFAVGDVAEVKIVSITPFGAFAQIIPGVDGLLHISQISTERITNVAQVLSIGDVVSAKIIEINDEQNRVSLSIRALKEEAKAKEAEEAAEQTEEAEEAAEEE